MLPLGDADTVLQLPTAGSKPERPRVSAHHLPEGEYEPLLLNVTIGPREFHLKRDNSLGGMNKNHGMISIRKDKPFVLDFSAKPELVVDVVSEVRQGHDLAIVPNLCVDADHGLVLMGVTDKSKPIGKVRVASSKVSRPIYALIDPTVVITDAAGKKVAEGKVQPYG